MEAETTLSFIGQHSDERVLHRFRPHRIRMVINFVILFTAIGIITAIVSYGSFYLSKRYPLQHQTVRLAGFIIAAAVAGIGSWWTMAVARNSITFLTTRRVIRIQPLFPRFERHRSLFWTEVTKAKASAPNLVFRMLNIGTVEVLPFAAEHEDIKIPDTYYFGDVANYIDKIIYLAKNDKASLSTLQPFINKPRGKRTPFSGSLSANM